MKINKLLIILFVVSLFSFNCGMYHSVSQNEVAVKTKIFRIIGKEGVEDKVYRTGVYFAFPFTQWDDYDITVQNLDMISSSKQFGKRTTYDNSLLFKTKDGNDISVDVTLVWRIDPEKAPYLRKYIGGSTRDVLYKLVRPTARSIIRDVLNELSSEEYYQSSKRFSKAKKAKEELQKVLKPYGIIIETVALHEHRFHPEYAKAIKDKTLAEQDLEKYRSMAQAAQQEALRNLELKKGEVEKMIAQARGKAEQIKIEADAYYYAKQKEAEAILAEKKAQAKAIKAMNEALASSEGARAIILKKLSEALKNKKIIFLPKSTGAQIQYFDLNKFLQLQGLQSISNQ